MVLAYVFLGPYLELCMILLVGEMTCWLGDKHLGSGVAECDLCVCMPMLHKLPHRLCQGGEHARGLEKVLGQTVGRKNGPFCGGYVAQLEKQPRAENIDHWAEGVNWEGLAKVLIRRDGIYTTSSVHCLRRCPEVQVAQGVGTADTNQQPGAQVQIHSTSYTRLTCRTEFKSSRFSLPSHR